MSNSAANKNTLRWPGAGLVRNLLRHYELYIMVLPAVVYIFVFCYIPMYGVQIAFRDFYPGYTITGSRWLGLENIIRFFNTYMCAQVIGNTLRISIMSLLFGFPLPILLALQLNTLTRLRLKKSLQMVSYAPYFISVTCMAGIMQIMLSQRGIVTQALGLVGFSQENYLGIPSAFSWVYALCNTWKGAGWNSIIYISALAGVDMQLYEAARIDGANRLQMIRHIDIPSIMPTVVILLILNCGQIMSVGWEMILLLQNAVNLDTSEVISTYTYKVGLKSGEYSYSTAIGLFNSVVNLTLLVVVNTFARKVGETSLW